MRRALLALALLLAACDGGTPEGQVVARLDGESITRRDLMIELGQTGAAADVDVARVQAGLLDAIVARKLIAAQARRLGLDRSPEYLARVRRDRELILADLLAERQAARLPAPDAAAVAAVARRIDAGGLPPGERVRRAAALAQEAQAQRTFDDTLRRLRARAEIVYQPGFGPGTTPPR